MPDEQLPKYVFGPMDVMPLVELANEAYDIARQHPSIRPPFVKWMNKFVLFMNDHQFNETPSGAMEVSDNRYLKLVREGLAKQVTDKMKDPD